MGPTQILEMLLKENKITQEDIERVKDAEAFERKELAIMLHSIMCDDEHATMEEITLGMGTGCNFYAEEQIENKWEQPAHKKYESAAVKFRAAFDDIEKIQEAAVIVYQLIADTNLRNFIYNEVYSEVYQRRN
jgi:hypothetical protein